MLSSLRRRLPLARSIGYSALTAVLFTACSFEDLLPKIGQGRDSARLTAEFGAVNAHTLPKGVEGVRLEILDVQIHGPDGEDEWWIVSSEAIEFDFNDEDGVLYLPSIPILAGSYDLIRIEFGEGSVMVDEKWQPAQLASSVLELEPKSGTARGKMLLQVRMSASGTVSGGASSGWTLDPDASVTFVKGEADGQGADDDGSSESETGSESESETESESDSGPSKGGN